MSLATYQTYRHHEIEDLLNWGTRQVDYILDDPGVELTDLQRRTLLVWRDYYQVLSELAAKDEASTSKETAIKALQIENRYSKIAIDKLKKKIEELEDAHAIEHLQTLVDTMTNENSSNDGIIEELNRPDG